MCISHLLPVKFKVFSEWEQRPWFFYWSFIINRNFLKYLMPTFTKLFAHQFYPFRLRIAREKTGLSSGVVVSGSPSEASEATSSPQSLKAKSESPEEKLSYGNEKSEKVCSKESSGNSNNLSSSSEKSMELFKEPSQKKSSRKLSETTKNPENEAKTLNEIQKKRLTKSGRNVSGSSNGMLPKTPSSTSCLTTARADSLNGESLVERSEKSSNGTGDTSKTESKHISSHPSENPETDIPKKKVRKTNFENQGVKLESSSGKSTNSTRVCGEMEEDMEIAWSVEIFFVFLDVFCMCLCLGIMSWEPLNPLLSLYILEQPFLSVVCSFWQSVDGEGEGERELLMSIFDAEAFAAYCRPLFPSLSFSFLCYFWIRTFTSRLH